jgi:hypothetical protein
MPFTREEVDRTYSNSGELMTLSVKFWNKSSKVAAKDAFAPVILLARPSKFPLFCPATIDCKLENVPL